MFHMQHNTSLITSLYGTLYYPVHFLLSLGENRCFMYHPKGCLLPFFTMFFLSALLQGSAHTEDAASLNNNHGGLPSASSTSSTELNHQVEAFRGLMRLPPV